MKPTSYLYKWYANHGVNQSLRRSAGRKFRRAEAGQKMTVKTVHEFLIAIKIGDPVDTQIALMSEFEPTISELIKKLAPSCANFVDIGCNIGYFTCLFRQYNKSAPIYAIDANPEMLARCDENLKINKFQNVTPVNVGVTEAEGTLPFYINRNTPSLASFGGHNKAPQDNGKSENISVIEIKTKPLPRIFSDLKIDTCSLVKIDIEGYEPSLFAGLTPDFHLHAERIIFEYVPTHIKSCKLDMAHIWQAPCMKFYDIFGLHTGNSTGYIKIKNPDEIPDNVNTILCIRNDLPRLEISKALQ